VSLTEDCKVAWSELGGLSSGPANGHWERLVEQTERGTQQYLALNFHAFREEARLSSTVLKRAGPISIAWHAVGSVTPSGHMYFMEPRMLADWHVVAVLAHLPA
jgi:hypothetical protein